MVCMVYSACMRVPGLFERGDAAAAGKLDSNHPCCDVQRELEILYQGALRPTAMSQCPIQCYDKVGHSVSRSLASKDEATDEIHEKALYFYFVHPSTLKCVYKESMGL